MRYIQHCLWRLMTHISSLAFVQSQSEQMKHVLVACNIREKAFATPIPIQQLILITVKKKYIYSTVLFSIQTSEYNTVLNYFYKSLSIKTQFLLLNRV